MARDTHSRTRRRRSKGRGARRDDGWQLERIDYSDARLGPAVHGPSIETVIAAVDGIGALDWSEAEANVVPLFDRVRPYPPGYPARLHTIVPPGIRISVGIDVGPAFLHVTPMMLDDWGLSLADLVAHALANLHRRAATLRPADVVETPVDGVPVVGLQSGLSIGSTLVLAPTELARLFGAQPRLLVAPMRDLLIGLPLGEHDLAALIFDEIATQDPNCLQPLAFAFDGRAVRVTQLASGLTAA